MYVIPEFFIKKQRGREGGGGGGRNRCLIRTTGTVIIPEQTKTDSKVIMII